VGLYENLGFWWVEGLVKNLEILRRNMKFFELGSMFDGDWEVQIHSRKRVAVFIYNSLMIKVSRRWPGVNGVWRTILPIMKEHSARALCANSVRPRRRAGERELHESDGETKGHL